MSDMTKEVKFKISLQKDANVEEAILAIKKALSESEKEAVKFSTTLSKNEGGAAFITATTKSTNAIRAFREEVKKLVSDQKADVSSPLIRGLLEVSSKEESTAAKIKAAHTQALADNAAYDLKLKMAHAQALADNAAYDMKRKSAQQALLQDHSQGLRDNAALDQKEISRQKDRNDAMRKLLADDLNAYNAYANATRAARTKATEVADSVGSSANSRLASARAASEREIALATATADSIEGVKLRQSIRLQEIEERTQNKILEYQRRAAAASLTGNNRAAALIPRNVETTISSSVRQTTQVNDTAAAEIASIQARTHAYVAAQQQMLSSMNSRIQMEQTILQHGANSEQAIVQRSMQEQTRLREELRTRIAQINSTATPNTYAADQARIASAIRVTEQAIHANNVATRDQINTLRELSPHGSTGGNLLSFIAQWGLGWRVVNSVINAVSSAIRSIPNAGIEMQSTISTLHASFSNNQDGTRNTAQGEALTAIAMTKMQEEAKRTGIALTTLEQNYRTFLASAHMAGESTATVNTIFKDLNTVTAALHMSGDRAQLTFLALSQMFNKGKVQSEELTKQLGNLLPGAFAAFAKATGRTTQQLTQDMKAGTVTAHENIAKFISFYASQYGDAFSKASAGLNAELGRLSTAWTNFSRGVFGGTGEIMADTVRGLTSLVESVTLSGAQMEKFGQQVKSVGIAFGAAGIAGAIAVIVSSPMILGLTAVAAAMAGIAKAVGMISDAKERDAKIGYGVQGVDDTYSGQSVEEQLKNKAAAIAKVTNERNALTSNKALFTPEETAQVEKLNHTLRMLGLQYTTLGQKVSEYEAINNTTAEFDSEMAKEHDAITKAIHPEVSAYEKLIATLGSLEKAQKLVVESNSASMEQWLKDPNTRVGVTALPALKSDVLAPGESETILADAHQKLLQKANTELESQQKASNDRRKALLDENLSNIKDNAAKQVSATEALNSDLQDKFNSGLLGLEEYIARSKKLSDEKFKAQLEANRQLQTTLGNELDSVVSSVQDKSPKIGLEIDDSKLSKAVLRYKDLIENASRNTGVSSGLIAAIMQTESAGKPNALSSANAMGLMQTLPATYRANGGAAGKIFDPEENINAGAKYLARLTDYFEKLGLQGEKLLTYTIAAYNAGAGNKGTSRIDRALHGNDKGFAETRAYVPKVLSHLSDTVSDSGTLKDTVDLQNKLNKAKADEVGLIADASKAESKRREETRKLYLDDIRAQADKFKPITLPSTFGNEVKDSAEIFTQEIMEGMRKQGAAFVTGWKANILAAGVAVRDEYNRIHEAIPVAERQLAQDKNNGTIDSASYERAKVSIQGMRDALEPLKQSLTDLGEANKVAGKTAEDWAEQQAKAVNEVIGAAEKQLNREISRATMSDSQSFIEEKRHQLQIRGVAIGAQEEAQLQHLLELQKQLLAVQQEQAVISSLKNGFVQGFKDILSGASDFGTAFKKIFDDTVNVILDNSLKNLVNGVQKAFSSLSSGGQVDWGSIGTSLVEVGASALVSWLSTSSEKAKPTAALKSNNSNIIGLNQMKLADGAAGKAYENTSISAIRQWNESVNLAGTILKHAASKLGSIATEYLTKIGATFAKTTIGSMLTPVFDFIKTGYTYLTNIGSTLINGAKNLISTATSAVTSAGTGAISGTTAAASAGGAAASGAAGGAGSAATSSLSSVASVAGNVLAVLKFGYDLFQIASNKYTTTLGKVSESMTALGMAAGSVIAGMVAVGAAVPVWGWIVAAAALFVGGVLKVADQGLTRETLTSAVSLGMSSVVEKYGNETVNKVITSMITPDAGLPLHLLESKKPNLTMLSGKRDLSNETKHDGFYTSSGHHSSTIGVETPFGTTSFRAGDMSQKAADEAMPSFLLLLKTSEAFENALAISITNVDALKGQTEQTMRKFTELNKPFEVEKDIKYANVAEMLVLKDLNITETLKQTGTIAGKVAGTWLEAFLTTSVDKKGDSETNALAVFNSEAVVATMLPQLVELPLTLAKLFTDNVRSIAEGSTQAELETSMNEFFTGWQIAKEGLATVGVNVEDTAIVNYLTSLTGIGLSVLSGSQNLVAYAATFKRAGENASSEFQAAFTGIFDTAKKLNMGKDQTAGYVGSYITLSNTADELGMKTSSKELEGLALKLDSVAMNSKSAADAEIDLAIAKENLTGITRQAAIEQLVNAGTIDKQIVANATYTKALADAQATMFSGIEFANQNALLLGGSLSGMGLSLTDVANIGANVTTTFKDLAEAMNFIDSVAKNVLSETEYTSGKKAQAASTFSSSAKALGLGENYTTGEFENYFRDTDKNGYVSQLQLAISKGDTARANALKNLGASYNTLTQAETAHTQAVSTASSTVDTATNTAEDNAKKLAEILKGVDDQLYALSHTELENKLHAVQVEMESLAASAAEAGGSIAKLDELSKAKLGKIAEEWSKPLLESFAQLGKSDLQNTLEGIGTRFGLLEKDAHTLASQGLVDLGNTLAGLNLLKLDEMKKALSPLATELDAIGKTKYTLSAEGINKWYKETLAVSDSIALAYGVDGQTAIDWINQIRNARVSALNEERNTIMQNAAEANANFQSYSYKQDSPEASGLANSLLSLKSSLLTNITTLVQAGGDYNDVMKLVSYATVAGNDQIAAAQAGIVTRYKAIFSTLQTAAETMFRMKIQAGFKVDSTGQTNQTSIDKQIADYDTSLALAQLKDKDFNVQMTGLNSLISLQQTKFDKEKEALQSNIDFVKTLKTYVKDLLLNANLSPLTNKQRLDEAQKQAYETFTAASAPTDSKERQEARSKLTSKADAYLSEAKAYYASSPEYARIFAEVTGALDNFGDTAVDPQKQLVDLNTQMLAALEAGNNILADLTREQTEKQNLDTANLSNVTQDIVNGFNEAFSALLKKFNLTPAKVDEAGSAIASLIDKVLVGLENLVLAEKLSPEAKQAIITAEKAFLDGALDYYSKGTITKDAYNALVLGRETLNLSLVNGLNAATMTPLEAKNIYDARNTVTGKLYSFLTTANLSPENISSVVEGFGILSANASYMLAGVGLTGEQIALISKGYSDSAHGVGTTLGALGLSEADRKWYAVGTGLFSQNVSKDVGNVKTPETALATVQTGITTMSETIRAGLSDVQFLKPAGDLVLSGINTLAGNIAYGLTHILDSVDASPITRALNSLVTNIASFISSQSISGSPVSPVQTVTQSATPGLDAIRRGDLTTAVALARASGKFTEQGIADYLGATQAQRDAVFSSLPKFANGGITSAESMYVAGEVREAIIPIPSGSVRAHITEPKHVGLTREELAAEVAKLVHELQRSAGSNEDGQDATITELQGLKDTMEVLNNKIERILSE